MSSLSLEGLHPAVSKRAAPFFDEILRNHRERVHSLYLVGSAVTADFHAKLSDINSVIVVHEFDFSLMRFLGSIGKRHKKEKVSAPLIMTPTAIRDSLDVFPVELLTFKMIHRTVYGPDILSDLDIDLPHLRLQCEREMKTRLVGLRQGYISSLGDRDLLAGVLSQSITGTIPVFRGIVHLLGKEPPVERGDVLGMLKRALEDHLAATDIPVVTSAFGEALSLKLGEISPSPEKLQSLFERYYHSIEAVDRLVNALRLPAD